jgi:hypothetical protein
MCDKVSAPLIFSVRVQHACSNFGETFEIGHARVLGPRYTLD